MTIKREMSLESVAEHVIVPWKRQKVVADGDESHAKRQELMAEVRRRTRAERQLKTSEVASHKQIRFVSDDLAKAEMEGFRSIFSGFWSDNDTSNLEATKLFQVQYLTEGTTSIEESVKAATIQRFVDFLLLEDSPHLQIEAAWALTLFISQTPKNTVNTAISLPVKAVTALVNMLESCDEDVSEQAAWALGIIARESPKCRDLVLKEGALHPLLRRMYGDARISTQRTSTWTVSNLCRGDPPPKFQQVKLAVPTIVSVIKSKDDEVQADACWALYYIMKSFSDKVENLQISPQIAELLQHPSPSAISPILKIFEVLGPITYPVFEEILKNGGFSCLRRLLMRDDMKKYQELVCSIILSYARTEEEIQAMIESGLIKSLVPLLRHGEHDIKLMAASIISDVISYSTNDQSRILANQGCLEVLSDLLDSKNKELLNYCLVGIEKMVIVGEMEKGFKEENEYVEILRNTGGLWKLIDLQCSKDEGIGQRAQDIVRICWEWWVWRSKRSKSTSSSNPASQSSDARFLADLNVADDDAEEEAPRYERPRGRDAAKKAAAASHRSSSSSMPYNPDEFRRLQENVGSMCVEVHKQTELKARKLQILEEKNALKKETLEMQKRRHDLETISQDYSHLPPDQREVMEQIRKDILDRFRRERGE